MVFIKPSNLKGGMMANKNSSNGGKNITKHHILPRSRGGNGENGGESNIVRIPQRIHDAWHVVFGNMTAKEAIKFIEIVFFGAGLKKKKITWKIEELYELQLNLQTETTIQRKKEWKTKK